MHEPIFQTRCLKFALLFRSQVTALKCCLKRKTCSKSAVDSSEIVLLEMNLFLHFTLTYVFVFCVCV